ncbi:hypothetical protein, partial [Salmonella sp. s54925]|uniref:hypothetical protein n=1 Tax=Salmonella sp. s54925 TaxID=3159674 RepID=UPI00397F1F03
SIEEWISGKDAEAIMISLEGGFQAKEKVASTIGTKNVMAGLSSKKISDGASASTGDSADFQNLVEEVAALKKRVEVNELEITQLKEEIKELKDH